MATFTIIQITSGVGPLETREFVALLAGYLQTKCETYNLPISNIVTEGDETAPKSVEIHLHGDCQPQLANESGTHALILRSAHRSRNARKRWYAWVHIYTVTDYGSTAAVIADCDLAITACRAGGPGGQHVNKVASAVRITHLPTGISLRVTSERSQRQNLQQGRERLARVLAQRQEKATQQQLASRRQAHYQQPRGNPIRTYTTGMHASQQPLIELKKSGELNF